MAPDSWVPSLLHPAHRQPQTPGSFPCSSGPGLLGPFPAPPAPDSCVPSLLHPAHRQPPNSWVLSLFLWPRTPGSLPCSSGPGLLGPFPAPPCSPPAPNSWVLSLFLWSRTPGSLPCSSSPGLLRPFLLHPAHRQPRTPGSFPCSSGPGLLGPFPAPPAPDSCVPSLLHPAHRQPRTPGSFPCSSGPGLLGPFPAPPAPGLLRPFPAPPCSPPSPELLGPFLVPLAPDSWVPSLLLRPRTPGSLPCSLGTWVPPADAAPPAELRGQLGEQQRGREAQAETRLQLLQDMGEFLRRKSELEQEYSRGLEKLSERFTTRLRWAKEHPRREQDPPSPLQCWQLVLKQTRQAGRDHGALSDIYAGPLSLHLAQLSDDLGRAVKKSRDLEQQMQDELLTMISELQMAMKAYQTHHAESQSAENKLRDAERQEEKRGARQPAEPGGTGPDKTGRRSSLRKGERLVEKRHARFLAAQAKCTGGAERLSPAPSGHEHRDQQLLPLGRLRHPRLLGPRVPSLPGPPAADVPGGRGPGPELLAGGAGDSGGGRAGPGPPRGQGPADGGQPSHLLPPPRASSTTPHEGDEVSEVQAVGSLCPELLLHRQDIEARLKDLSLETEEVNKTLQATMSSLRELLGAEEPEVLEAFGGARLGRVAEGGWCRGAQRGPRDGPSSWRQRLSTSRSWSCS
ncbi:unnamed protein product [Lepidochelys kempii]